MQENETHHSDTLLFDAAQPRKELTESDCEKLRQALKNALSEIISNESNVSGLLIVGSAVSLFTNTDRPMNTGSDLEVIPITREPLQTLQRSELANRIAARLQANLARANILITIEAFYPEIYINSPASLDFQAQTISSQLATNNYHLLLP